MAYPFGVRLLQNSLVPGRPAWHDTWHDTELSISQSRFDEDFPYTVTVNINLQKNQVRTYARITGPTRTAELPHKCREAGNYN